MKNYLLQKADRLQAALDVLSADMNSKGKDKYGVFLFPHNEARNLIQAELEKTLREYRETEEGILAEIERAEAAGPIFYATVHPLCPTSIGFYKRDTKSPSGRISCGGVPNTPLAQRLIAEKQVGMRLSGAITHDYRK